MNPALRQLGFGPDDRVLLVHADDIGMCHATVAAYEHLLDAGIVRSGSVMAPCAWLPAAGALSSSRPDADLGLHLTFTCEWDAYRWRPLSTVDPAAGLGDADGYFPRTPQEVWQRADPRAAVDEAYRQLEAALDAGVEPTHFDVHMAAFDHPRLLHIYLDWALEHRVPLRIPAMPGPRPDDPWQQAHWEAARRVEAAGTPLFDAIYGLSLEQSEGKLEAGMRIVDGLRPGLSQLVAHPALDTPELRAIAPDWRGRVADYETLRDQRLREYILAAGITLIGYRPLVDLLADTEQP